MIRFNSIHEHWNKLVPRHVFTGFFPGMRADDDRGRARICIIKVQLARRIMCQRDGEERRDERMNRSCTTGNVEYVFVSGVLQTS